jgi:hypothetical protein
MSEMYLQEWVRKAEEDYAATLALAVSTNGQRRTR